MPQPGFTPGNEKMWWWKVTKALDDAQIALVNAMAHNLDDPQAGHALQDRLTEGQAILLAILTVKGFLPGTVAPQVSMPPPPQAVPPQGPQGPMVPMPPPGMPPMGLMGLMGAMPMPPPPPMPMPDAPPTDWHAPPTAPEVVVQVESAETAHSNGHSNGTSDHVPPPEVVAEPEPEPEASDA